VNEVGPTVPRLLINKQSAGVWRRVTGEEDVPTIGNYRDVALLGDSDEGVTKLAQLLHWGDDLRMLSENGKKERSQGSGGVAISSNK
jgi:hypothetical protein